MKRTNKWEYSTPEVEHIDIAVEAGFSISDPYGREYEDGGDFI